MLEPEPNIRTRFVLNMRIYSETRTNNVIHRQPFSMVNLANAANLPLPNLARARNNPIRPCL
jgi:hypothetical protein